VQLKDVEFKEVLATNNLNCEKEAEELARSKTAFVIIGYDYAHD
jgi:hypothetical protein